MGRWTLGGLVLTSFFIVLNGTVVHIRTQWKGCIDNVEYECILLQLMTSSVSIQVSYCGKTNGIYLSNTIVTPKQAQQNNPIHPVHHALKPSMRAPSSLFPTA